MSAGKMYSATGLRVGFAIGNEDIIKGMKAAQTYHIFCLNPIIQTAKQNVQIKQQIVFILIKFVICMNNNLKNY